MYPLYSHLKPHFIKKPITHSTPTQISQHSLYHIPLPQHHLLQLPQTQSNTIPLYIPYLTPYFIPTPYKHPPFLLPNP
ncbi:oleate hydratase, partial [Staphylococcus epidermidis]|uniref:oleate hydratase n=1 Tax=Staphylococcus epidermidis TaxID=1282 RepID=UPI0037DA6249